MCHREWIYSLSSELVLWFGVQVVYLAVQERQASTIDSRVLGLVLRANFLFITFFSLSFFEWLVPSPSVFIYFPKTASSPRLEIR